ncbi:uncharacterized protein [Antedon mediterranea]|uniref:uncharacterized protein n=1 Tax=Antedon mediterranea TaxID=105859 RepID=UPI003AF77B4E
MKIKRKLFKTIMAIPPCQICKITLTSPAHAEQHYSGKSHQKRLKVVENYKTTGSDVSTDYCRICNVAYSSETQRLDHEKGQRHINALKVKENIEDGVILYCEYCQVQFTNISQKREHSVSSRHIRKAQNPTEQPRNMDTPQVLMEEAHAQDNIGQIESSEDRADS